MTNKLISMLLIVLSINSNFVLSQENTQNISLLLKNLQGFIEVEKKSQLLDKKLLKKEFIPSSISEMLPLISTKNKKNILFFTKESESFLEDQYSKLITILETKKVSSKDVKTRIKVLNKFYETNNDIEVVWLNKIHSKKSSSSTEKVDIQDLIQLVNKSKSQYETNEIISWDRVLNELSNINEFKGSSYATKLSDYIQNKDYENSMNTADEWSEYISYTFSDSSFFYLHKTLLNHLQEIQLIKYDVWKSKIKAKLGVLDVLIKNTNGIEKKSNSFEYKINEFDFSSKKEIVDESIPEWQRGVQDLKKYSLMKQGIKDLHNDFSNWIGKLNSAHSKLSSNSNDYLVLSTQGIQIIDNITYIEGLRKKYWDNESKFYTKNKTKEWLNYLTSSAVQTEQYRELSNHKEFTQKLIVIISILIGILLAVVIYTLIKKNKSILSTQKELEKSNIENKVITDRILEALDIAERVQKSLVFPKESELTSIIPNIEIAIQNPYQSVTGDFYWAKKVSENKKIFCLVDCESHGSPAALGTVAVKQILDKISINEDKVKVPTLFMESFISEQSKLPNFNELEDSNSNSNISSMRLAQASFLWIDERKRELTYISDHNDMYILRESGELIELKRTMNPATDIIKYTVSNLREGDVLFVFTDGIKDRLIEIENTKGIIEEKRLGARRLKSILQNVNNIRIEQQESNFSNLFESELEKYPYIEKVDDETAIFINLSLN